MSIVLKNLPNSELPEPKDVSTASEGMVYRADGAGSGDWTYLPLGWGYYQHSGAAQVFNTTPAKLQINGAGVLTNENFLPREIRGSGNLWDTTAHKITPVRLGDSYDLRLELPVTADSGAGEITIALDIGATTTPTTVILNRYNSLSKTPPYTISIGFPIVALTSTTVNNGIQLFLSTDSGSVDITDPSITIVKNVDGDF